jgi:hypothetical protein
VVAGAGKVTVTVAAGTATDGTPGGVPSSYTVTRTPATTPPTTCTVTGAPWACDVTGLAAGIAYAFTATATNTAGTSAASAASAPVTLDAVSVSRFKVSYQDAWADDAGHPNVPATQSVVQGSSVTLAANVATPCAETCVAFAGWSPLADDSGAVYSAGQVITPTKNLVLYAQWFPLITYEPNGGLGTMPAKVLVAGGGLATSTFTNGNLLFVGWNTKADGTGRLYAIRNSWAFNFPPVAKLTMYAQWRAQYRVRYDMNGATGTIADSFYDAQVYTVKTSQGASRPGYRWTGWCLNPVPVEAECTVGGSYADFESGHALKSDETYFARWTPN